MLAQVVAYLEQNKLTRSAEKQKDIDATFFLPPALINKF